MKFLRGGIGTTQILEWSKDERRTRESHISVYIYKESQASADNPQFGQRDTTTSSSINIGIQAPSS